MPVRLREGLRVEEIDGAAVLVSLILVMVVWEIGRAHV